MSTTVERKVTTRRRQISVPMTDFEDNRLDRFLKKSGMKKGDFTRQALIHWLDEQEGRQGQAIE